MKNLTKLFVAVAALFAGFSCVTDVTEDLGVKVGGQTTLTISLEESRTQLGEKADGVYPLYWSEGDKISINGVESSAVSADVAGATAAEFTFDGVLNHPYNVVYPASTANEVTFPAIQNYVAGTFAAGAAPMYGYAEVAGSAVQMHHLAGALRFDVAGTATLSSVVVVAESGSLSGTYTVDCATGELTAKEGSTSSSVSLTFGEGLTLTDTPTPLYIAVPAGNYGMVTVKLYSTADEVMTVKFDTTSKPVKAGAVREFAPITYAGVADTSDFVIDSKDALIRFAANPSRNAVVTANIDMTGYDWTPIDGFAKSFDGGNFEIKGLNDALFRYTSATEIKNVKLVDVNITVDKFFVHSDNARVYAGSLAYYFENSSGKVTNCSASGNIVVDVVYKNSDTTQSTDSNYAVSISGLVGMVYKCAEFSGCTNRTNVNVKSLFGADGESNFYTHFGGIVGGFYSCSALSKCTNYGNISINTGQQTGVIRCGGAIGYANTATLYSEVKNYGDIYINTNTTSGMYVAGVVSNTYKAATFDKCENYGAITIENNVKCGKCFVGQMGASCSGNSTIKNCIGSNNASGKGITIGCDCSNLYAGFFGKYPASETTSAKETAGTSKVYTNSIADSTNSSDLTITSDFSSTSSSYPTLGMTDTTSAAANAQTISNFHVSGDITVNGLIKGYAYIAGIVGYWRSYNAKAYKLTMTDCSYSGNIIVNGQIANRPAVGGIMAYNSGNYASLTNVHHTGNITVHNTFDGIVNYWMSIGGIIGYDGQEPPLTNCTNSGDITVTGNFVGVYNDANHPLRVGGIVGYPNSFAKVRAGVVNTGDITIGAKGVETKVNFLCVGGIWGEVTSASATMTDPINTGNITITNVTNASVADSYVGGVVGKTVAKVTNAQCYCNIAAAGYTNLGWATGSARVKDSIVATNCKFGGNLVEIEVDEEDESQKEKLTPLTSENFFDHIFGGTTDWTGVENYDGCTLLTASPLSE
ncbi:MAG: hypothetical protein IKY24_02820 [Alistipes sp.]|nr:hypothetical protein [Alistipes sp.]